MSIHSGGKADFTVFGEFGSAGFVDGLPHLARFHCILGVTEDPKEDGLLYVLDTDEWQRGRIRKVFLSSGMPGVGTAVEMFDWLPSRAVYQFTGYV